MNNSGSSSVEQIKKELNAFIGDLLKDYSVQKGCGAKVIHDPIWKSVYLEEWEIQLLDSPLLQRLKNINQLGLAQLVFPSAKHSRFEHTLGVLYLSDIFAKKVFRYAAPHEKEMLFKTRIAALLHDIGHTFFSHATEHAIENHVFFKQDLPKVDERFKNINPHEVMAYLIINTDSFKDFFKNKLQLPSDLDIRGDFFQDIGDLIIGEKPAARHSGNERFVDLYRSQIINGQFDADKIDYLHRDSYFTGVEISFDFERFLNKMDIIETNEQDADGAYIIRNLAFDYKAIDVFEKLIFGKLMLTSRVYKHQKVLAAETLLSEIVVNLFNTQKINIVNMLKFDDTSFLYEIEKIDKASHEKFTKIVTRKLPKRAFIINNIAIEEGANKIYDICDSRESYEKVKQDIVIESQRIAKILNRNLSHDEILFVFPKARSISNEPAKTSVFNENKVPDILNNISPLEEWVEALNATKACSYIYANANDRDIVFEAAKKIFCKYGITFTSYLETNTKHSQDIIDTRRKYEELMSSKYMHNDTYTDKYLELNYDLYKEMYNKKWILSFCYIDMNNLKYLNDAFSHDTGDKAINKVIQFLNELVETESYAVTARLKTAGDEFGIVSIFQDETSQKLFYERLKTPLEINRTKTRIIPITLSAGVSFCYNDDPSDFSALVSHADATLKKVKKSISCSTESKHGIEYKIKKHSDYAIAPSPKNKKKSSR